MNANSEHTVAAAVPPEDRQWFAEAVQRALDMRDDSYDDR